MDKSKKFNIYLFLLFFGIVPSTSYSQKATTENTVFWEIKGNDLTQPSYLFGTFHLMGKSYVDSLSNVMNKFRTSNTVVGELVMDSTLSMKMMIAARMQETTLDKLLTPEEFKNTAAWLKDISGYDLKMFNNMNPMTVQIFLMTMLQQKYFPLDPKLDTPMDMYFQNEAKKERKKIVGLETFETQVNALFHQFSLQRQSEMLVEFVKEKEKAQGDLLIMNESYRDGKLDKLEELLSAQTYSISESEVMLDNRNKKWMEQLPALMKEGQAFIAVGALHLTGYNGLINLFRMAGYTVTPIGLK